MKTYTSFEEFWPFYVREHSNRISRGLHFVGTTAAVCNLLVAITVGPLWLLAITPLLGYGGAWAGHLFFEKNRPATFTYPLWSLRGDFVMWAKIATGKMQQELEQAHQAAAREKSSEAQQAPVASLG